MQFYNIAVQNITKLTSDAVCISFAIPKNLQAVFNYKQGQYITIKALINGAEIRRSYSICSSPLSGQLQIGVKKVTQGVFSTYANTVLKVGDTLELAAPNGKFYTELNIENSKNYFATAAGSGITPIMSLISTTLLLEPNSKYTLVYGNKNRRSIMFKEELEALKNKFINRLNVVHILSQEKLDAAMFSGRINNEKCEQLGEQLIQFKNFDEAFLCGPESMVLELKIFLQQVGLNPKNIHAELFGTNKVKSTNTANHTLQTDAKICKLDIIKDGLTQNIDLPFNTDNILDAAMLHGADLPYACKGGVCCTCKAKLISGQINMEVNYGLEQDEIDAGYILTCQAWPITENVVVSFDDI